MGWSLTRARKKKTNISNTSHGLFPHRVEASFLDCFTFFTEADPTHGLVVYVDQQEAEELLLGPET